MHCMLDLETYGRHPGCAIRSVGAVAFHLIPPPGPIDTFYCNIDDESCRKLELEFDPSTVRWWEEQSKEAQKKLQENPIGIETAVKSFHDWFQWVNGEYLWCQGANFDEPIWQAVARKLHLHPPWDFRNVRDTRTAYALNDFDPKQITRHGTAHNALDDAKFQMKCVQLAIAKGRARTAPTILQNLETIRMDR